MSKKATAAERRLDKRIPHGRAVTVRVFESPDSEPDGEFKGVSIDVSPEGVCIEGKRALPTRVNLELGLRFEGSPGEFLHWAQVRWVDPVPERGVFRMGLLFTLNAGPAKSVWTSFLRTLSRVDTDTHSGI